MDVKKDKVPFLCCPELQLETGNDVNSVWELLGRLRPTWRREEVVTKDMSSIGIINHMRCYHLKQDIEYTDAIVVRIYGTFAGDVGDKEDSIISRTNEVIGMQVAHVAGCFPPILATFGNGLAYQYAQGRHLDGKDLLNHDILRAAARSLANLHCVDIDNMVLYDRHGIPVRPKVYPAYRILRFMRVYMAKAPSQLQDKERNKRYMYAMAGMEAEIDSLASIFDGIDFDIALCHNDVHVLNMVYDERTGDLQLVDYEMVEYGYAVLDLAYVFYVHEYMNRVGMTDDTPLHGREDLRKIMVGEYLHQKWKLKGYPSDEEKDLEHRKYLLQVEILIKAGHLAAFTFNAFMIDGHNLEDYDLLPQLELSRQKYFDSKPKIQLLFGEYKRLHRKHNFE